MPIVVNIIIFSTTAESQNLKMQNGIVAGIVLAILIPLLLALLCFFFYCRERVKKQQEDDNDFGTFRPSNFKSNFLPNSKKPSPPDNIDLQEEDTIEDVPLKKEQHQHADEEMNFPTPSPPPPSTPPTTLRDLGTPNGHKIISPSSSSASSTTIESSSGTTYSPNGQVLTHAYYTNEPVNDRPVKFENVLWGVEEHTPSPPSSNSQRDFKRSQTPSQESTV